MKLLDHTRTDRGYTIRIWLEELGPDAVRTYTWIPYKGDDSDWSFTEAQYRQQQVEQATKLAQQELSQLNPDPVVITQDTEALAALETAQNSQTDSSELERTDG